MIKRLDSLSFQVLFTLFDKYVGQKVADIEAPGSFVLLNIRSGYIYLHLDNNAIAFGLTDPRRIPNRNGLKGNTTIEQLLKKYILGGTIVGFEQPPFDRKFNILIENYNFTGARVIYRLEFASYSAYSNLWLWQGDELIGSYRNYQPPQSHIDYNLENIDSEKLDKLIVNHYNEEPKNYLLKVHGLYPAIIDYLLSVCDNPQDSSELYRAIDKVKSEFTTEPEKLWNRLYSPDKPIQAEGLNKAVFDEIVINSLNKGFIAIRNRHLSELKKKISQEERSLAKLDGQLNTYSNAESVSMDANLLKGEIYKYVNKPTPKKITVWGYDGAEKTIELDPALSITDNMNKLYARYRKYKRGLELVQTQKDTKGRQIEELNEKLFWLQKAANIDELNAITGKEAKTNRGGGQKLKTEWIQIDDTPWRYAVGTNANLNKLLLSQAKDTDIWFHAHNIPSSHLLLRHDNPREADINNLPDDVLLLCANSVADNSSVANDKKVSIIYTQYKYVRKVPEFVSLVTYTHEKNIVVDRGKDK